jgi:Bacterial cadherin-like domain
MASAQTTAWRLHILYGEEPKAVDDSYTTRQDRRLEVSARKGVLANDTDGDPEAGVETRLTARWVLCLQAESGRARQG